MTDFISELRTEMVEAAERLERRGRIGHAAWPLHPRVWGRAATRGALAVAACALAVVVAVTALKSPAPQPGRLKIAALVHVGGQPTDAVLAGGSLWIGDTNGGVTRIDPRSRRIIGHVPTGGDVWTVSAGEGQLWVGRLDNRKPGTHGTANHGDLTLTLLRVDPRTGRVIARIHTRAVIGEVVISDNSLWFQEVLRGTLGRLDPNRGVVTARIPAQTSMLLVGTPRTLWSLSASGTLTEIDAASRRIVHRVPQVVPIVTQNEGSRSVLAADATGAWASYPEDGTVTRVEQGHITDRIVVGPGAGLVAATPDMLWVTYGDSTRLRYALAKIDARSGRIITTLSLGDNQPKTLVPIGDTLWIITTGGNALLVRP